MILASILAAKMVPKNRFFLTFFDMFPKMPPRRPKMPPRAPKMAPRRPKRPPRAPKMPPRASKRAPGPEKSTKSIEKSKGFGMWAQISPYNLMKADDYNCAFRSPTCSGLIAHAHSAGPRALYRGPLAKEPSARKRDQHGGNIASKWLQNSSKKEPTWLPNGPCRVFLEVSCSS